MWWPAYHVRDPVKDLAWIQDRIGDIDLLLSYCGRCRLCVQAGGHVGLWPLRLARAFERVLTFEPDPGCYEAMLRNGLPGNALARPYALGNAPGLVHMRPGASAGSTRLRKPGDGYPVEVITLDSLNLSELDALVLDVEGMEAAVLDGARATVRRCRPIIMVEEWDRAGSLAFMSGLGYRRAATVHSDGIYVP